MKNNLPRASGLSWKNFLRQSLVPKIAGLGNFIGIHWKTLGAKLGREVLVPQVSAINSKSDFGSAEQSLDVVFLTMIGGHTYNASVDVALGLALRARGHRVRVVVCDQQLPVCEVKKAGQEHDWKRACAKCWGFGRKYFEAAGFEVIPSSQLVRSAQNQDISVFSEFVDAALLKHYGRGMLEDSADVQKRRALFEESAAISSSIGAKLIEWNVDRVVMSHGIYCTWGPARELLNEAGVPVLTYSKGKKKQVEKFNWTTGADWWDVSDEWEKVRDKPLTDSQELTIDSYLASRKKHSADTLVYNFGEEETLEQTRERLGLSPNKTTYVLFTNVLWDAASAQREIAFDGPIEWVIETINWVSRNPDKQLIVKIHPAEVVIGTNQPFASIIYETLRELPTNVRIIEPHEEVNSWSIMRVADLGVVHTSTVGMELPLEGIPCAVVSRTHYRGRGFTIDVEGKQEYFDLLQDFNPRDVNQKTLMTLSKRYAYLLFERYQLPFDIFHEPTHTNVQSLAFDTIDELLSHKSIQIFISAFEAQTDFLLEEDPNDWAKNVLDVGSERQAS